ncbi:MAG: hypothetical protein U0Z26_02700 [Anaerolineales bacterium]
MSFAEFETAIAAALGDTGCGVSKNPHQLEDAMQLFESDDAGRAALLPLNDKNNIVLDKPNDDDCIGVASHLVNAPEEYKNAVQLMLGHTLIVNNRSAARRLIQDLPTHADVSKHYAEKSSAVTDW